MSDCGPIIVSQTVAATNEITSPSNMSSSESETDVKVLEMKETVVFVQEAHKKNNDEDDEEEDTSASTTTIIGQTTTTTAVLASTSDEFDPYLLYNAFVSAVLKSNEEKPDFDDVSLRCYLIAYEEITKFLYNLGNIFYFVIADLRKKIGQLDAYLQRQPDEYETFQRMVKYEWTAGKLSKPTACNKQNATRIVLRLHRALIFIIRLLEKVFYAESHFRTPQLCTEAYESTLAKYHRYFVALLFVVVATSLTVR